MAKKNALMRVTGAIVTVLIALTAVPMEMRAQQRGGRGAGAAPDPGDTDTRPYDKHDFSGLWARNPQAYGLGPCTECRDQALAPGYGFFGTVPPRTAEGEKRLLANKPGRGYELNSKDAKDHPDVDSGYKRAVLPAFGNDPEGRCEPLGLMRNIAFSGGGATMEMVQAKANDKIIQRFEWTWDNREIWLDGRQLPKVEDYLPRFNGYSVAKWEGDTLVVTSNGFDDRQWLDQYGFPVSEKAVLEERWDRPSPNRLRVKMTLTDPVNYTRPWPASVKVWALIPTSKMSVGGWGGILEDRCVPSDEHLFNTFRDKAAGK